MLITPLVVQNNRSQSLDNDGEDVIYGLTQVQKKLPPKYFYDDRGSELFEKICELPEYYPTRTEASILHQYANEIARFTGCCELIELGSGSSTKTRLLLDAYQQLPGDYRYIPIDVSGGILKTSVQQLSKEYPKFTIKGLIGTYDRALVHLESTSALPRMIFFLGSSMGNFTPQAADEFWAKIATTLNPGDYFLLGIDLQKSPAILEAAYNDSQGVTAAFNLNMLSHLNWRFQGNFDPDLFTHQAIYNQTDTQIEMYLHCQQAHCVSLAALNLNVSFAAGESILTEISRKFDLTKIRSQLGTHGLNTMKIWTDPARWFGLILCQA